jgi:hypothetical protein
MNDKTAEGRPEAEELWRDNIFPEKGRKAARLV